MKQGPTDDAEVEACHRGQVAMEAFHCNAQEKGQERIKGCMFQVTVAKLVRQPTPYLGHWHIMFTDHVYTTNANRSKNTQMNNAQNSLSNK